MVSSVVMKEDKMGNLDKIFRFRLSQSPCFLGTNPSNIAIGVGFSPLVKTVKLSSLAKLTRRWKSG